MLDLKDSAIKLFGQTIPLPLYTHPHSFSDDHSSSGHSSLHENEQLPCKQDDPLPNRETSGKEITDDKQEDPTTTTATSTTPGVSKRTKSCSPERETSAQKTPENGGGKGEEEQEEEEEMSISQEKASKKPEKILACPRCNSMDTKFCYYNNYNVKQPRHFCKKCQRYWTAGGTMRNVPVGAGRRKNKNSASHYRHIMLSESLRTAQFQAVINGIDNPSSFGTASTVLNFGSDSPICESQGLVISCGRETDTSSKKQAAAVGKNYQSFTCFPWPYPWNSTISAASFSPSGFPVSICPWNMPPYPLGKHSNEEEPSTLRLEEDPGHRRAGKTSVWGTNRSIFNRDGFLKGNYQSKNDDRIYRDEKSLVLHANPAALSRSLNFHESR